MIDAIVELNARRAAAIESARMAVVAANASYEAWCDTYEGDGRALDKARAAAQDALARAESSRDNWADWSARRASIFERGVRGDTETVAWAVSDGNETFRVELQDAPNAVDAVALCAGYGLRDNSSAESADGRRAASGATESWIVCAQPTIHSSYAAPRGVFEGFGS